MSSMFLRPSTAALFGLLALLSPLSAQSENPAHVMVLGVFHFANPGLDVVKTEARQAEIRDVVEALARFGARRIAVEETPDEAPRLDSLFRAYREGRHELSRNETEQLGFRLAARAGLPRLHPIDYRTGFPFGPLMEYAREHDPTFVAFVDREIQRMTAEANRRQAELPIGEILRLNNGPEELEAEHGVYMRFLSVGAGDSYVGAELVSKWYERNIHIFANLQRIAKPGERVLVIIGAGHVPILQHLIRSDPALRLTSVLDYLQPQ